MWHGGHHFCCLQTEEPAAEARFAAGARTRRAVPQEVAERAAAVIAAIAAPAPDVRMQGKRQHVADEREERERTDDRDEHGGRQSCVISGRWDSPAGSTG